MSHPSDHDLDFELPPPPRVSAVRLVVLGLVVVAGLGALFVVGYLPRRHERESTAQTAVDNTDVVPRVNVVRPKAGASTKSLALPGSIEPLEQTTIYPRANGYVRKWLVDLGDRVKENQSLAEIETPELDQELLQAKAQLAQGDAAVAEARTNRDLAKMELDRSTALVAAGVASQQDLDQRRSTLASNESKVMVAQAQRAAYDANMHRLQQLQAYARVEAPFDGVIVERKVERGALVTAGNTTPLFRIAATDPVRVFIQVPQSMAPSVHPGQPVKVAVREYPGRDFQGKVAHVSGALDPASRTLTVEVRVPNADNALLTGMYAQAQISLPVPHTVFTLPSNAVSTGADGVRVATVRDDGTLHFATIVVERDDGATVDVATGLTGDERVIVNPTAALREAAPVRAEDLPPKAP